MKGLSLKDHYKNQKFNNLHEFFWGFGTAFHTVYAVVPLFLKELGAPDVIATSSAGLFSIIIAMPMLFTAAFTRNVNNLKKMVIRVHCLTLMVTFLLGYIFAFSNIGNIYHRLANILQPLCYLCSFYRRNYSYMGRLLRKNDKKTFKRKIFWNGVCF